MSDERFVLKFDSQENEYFIRDNFEEEEELGSYTLKWGVRKLNEQQATINRQAEQIKKLSDLLFVERTNNAFDRTEISRQTFTKEEFLKELEKWSDSDE